MESNNTNPTYTPQDYKSEQSVRWCPGCGDHAILNVLHKAMAELGVAPKDTAVISGIGCSSRLPYYMNTYGMHTIHGRAAAIATGLKTARPDMTVWQISGDGDGLAIGGNHFIHAVRRNVDINILLFNNKIYGLTKGQYSPTSDRGSVTKSSPYGTTEDPFIPAELVFGARGNFFARSIDIALDTTKEVMVAGAPAIRARRWWRCCRTASSSTTALTPSSATRSAATNTPFICARARRCSSARIWSAVLCRMASA